MPDIRSDKQTATTYPSTTLYNAWTEHADQLGIPISQFIIRMVEAGRKQINMEDIASDSLHELRQQQADLQSELEHQRQRNKRLERQLHQTAYADIVDLVEKNPGIETPEIIQHVADTVPARVASHLDVLEGDILHHREDGFYYEDSSTDERAPITAKSNSNDSNKRYDS